MPGARGGLAWTEAPLPWGPVWAAALISFSRTYRLFKPLKARNHLMVFLK